MTGGKNTSTDTRTHGKNHTKDIRKNTTITRHTLPGHQEEHDYYEAYPTEAEGPDEDNEWECHDAELEDSQNGTCDEDDQDIYE